MTPSLVVPLLLGVLCGGLINYFADELPHDRRLGRPCCPHCGSERSWADFLLARACRVCGNRPGIRPWIVVGVSLGVSLFTWLREPRTAMYPGYYLGILVFSYLALVTVIDLEHRLVLRATSVFGAGLALGTGIWLRGLQDTLLGGLAGLLIMGTLYLLGMAFTRFRARRLRDTDRPMDNEEALGSGDITLAVIIGLLLGWPMIWFGLLMGILIGGVMGLAILLVELASGRYAQRALMLFMPYGPAFLLSAFLIMFVPAVVASLLPGS